MAVKIIYTQILTLLTELRRSDRKQDGLVRVKKRVETGQNVFDTGSIQ